MLGELEELVGRVNAGGEHLVRVRVRVRVEG